MKTLLCVIALVLVAVSAMAALSGYQGLAPNGKKDAALTVNSTTLNMANDIEWSVYVPSSTTTCVFRTMSTATKAGLAKPIPAATWTSRKVNGATPFINFTGCTAGFGERM